MGDDFCRLLDSLKLKEPMIHDIRVKINDTSLHQRLTNMGTTKNPKNGSFTVGIPPFDNNITTKVSVYPETILVMLGCTYKPLIHNPSSMWFIHEHLSKISYHLTSLGAVLPSVNEWVITHYHLNKDGSQSLSGQTFHYTVEEVASGMLRFYSKSMPDGSTIPRLEQLRSPNRSLSDEMRIAMFASSNNGELN